jgi:hypothetical protein
VLRTTNTDSYSIRLIGDTGPAAQPGDEAARLNAIIGAVAARRAIVARHPASARPGAAGHPGKLRMKPFDRLGGKALVSQRRNFQPKGLPAGVVGPEGAASLWGHLKAAGLAIPPTDIRNGEQHAIHPFW